jgi:hypothetical protein
LLSGLLSSIGFEVLEATNGTDAIECQRRSKIPQKRRLKIPQ